MLRTHKFMRMLYTLRYGLLAVLCLVVPFAHALTAPVSETFPLADTLYGPSYGEGKLRTDGRHPFLFWIDEDRLYVTRIDGQERVGKLVFPFPVTGEEDFDAVWTGSHFLVVVQSIGYDLLAQLVDASGDPVREPVQLAENALWPRVAFNGSNALVMYNAGDGVMTQLLTPVGRPAGEAEVLEAALLSSSEFHLVSNGDGFAAIVPEGAHTPQSLYVLSARGRRVSAQTLENSRADWSLVSNGSQYFAVSGHAFGPSSALLFQADGTLVTRVDLHPTAGFQRSYRHAAAAWTGTRWLVALYVENGSFTRLAEIDAEGRIEMLADRTGVSDMQLVNAGGQVSATWTQQGSGIVSGPPLSSSTQRVLFAARHQAFLATATSSTGTLFLWRDLEYARGALRAGFRRHDGRWSERELTTEAGYAVAASDGTGFVVVTRAGFNGHQIIRLDVNGNPIPGGTEPFTAFAPLAIASNGTGYAVVGMRMQDYVPNGNLLAAAITGSGVSPVREIPFQAAEVVGLDIASDGERYLVSWGVQEECSPRIQFCGAARIAGVLLTGSAAVEGPLLRLTEDEHSGDHELEWNGREYVLATNAGGLTAWDISRAGVPLYRHVLNTEHASGISVVPAGDGNVAVAWISDRGARMTMLTDSGADPQPLTIDNDPRYFPWYESGLAAIGQGRFAFVFTAPADEAPIHGRRHLMAKIVAPALPSLPPAPVLTVMRFGATVSMEWTASGPVTGFRVEQRVGDGPWVEVGGWRDADERFLTVRTLDSPQFRVRAFNEAGAGPYSAWAVRRRAVR
ncbi:MAG TPA: fibronectin type III domain-containing protein [Thermoanaerobaculia bacterium]|nr:fibronectin type III domain-containing protein [Thermoanaerobaculia bacterium]